MEILFLILITVAFAWLVTLTWRGVLSLRNLEEQIQQAKFEASHQPKFSIGERVKCLYGSFGPATYDGIINDRSVAYTHKWTYLYKVTNLNTGLIREISEDCIEKDQS